MSQDQQIHSRPPHRTAIGIDVGGTKISGAVVTEGGEIFTRIFRQTPANDSGSTVLAVLIELVDELRRRDPGVKGVGIGAAGMVEWPAGRIRWAPNNSYTDLQLREEVHRATDLPTVVDNDANVVAWAEGCVGAAAGVRDLLAITVGTGVGGGLILDGQLYRGPSGIGMEVGHVIVDSRGGQLCGCGNRGCLEAVASGTALGRNGRKVALNDPDGPLATRAGGVDRVTGESVFESATNGDQRAVALFDDLAYWLGIGLASLVNLFDVQKVVVSGGMVSAGRLLLEPMCKSYERHVFGSRHRTIPPVVPAHFGSDAGVVGAAMLILRNESTS